jgi:nitrogen-specific signal transduction histidine kinase
MIQQKNESRDILESLEESIIIIDGDKTISFVNDKFVNQFKKLIEPLNEPPKIIEKQNFLSCFKKKKR